MRRTTRAARGAALLLALGLLLPAAGAPPAAAERSRPARLASRTLILDAADRDGLAVAVGERGHVLVSRDAGKSWAQVDVPTRALLTGVHLHDGKLGWAVGHDETILRTRDGGATWERVRHDPEAESPLLDVWFADEKRGLAVGAYGVVLSTRDGGESWEERTLVEGDDLHLNAIAASGAALWVAGEAGALYRSDDSGESWARVETPYDGSFFGLLPLADGGLLVFGLRGTLLRTDDGGRTFTHVDSGTEATLTAGRELGGGRVAVAGMAGALLLSEDGGRSFRLREQGDRKAALAVLPGNPSGLVLLGEGGARSVEPAY